VRSDEAPVGIQRPITSDTSLLQAILPAAGTADDLPGDTSRGSVSSWKGRRLHGAIAFRLGVAIVSGKHQPGDVLPSETEGAEALKVSRGAYREALRTLAAKGLVKSRPRAGTVIQPRRRWHLLDPDVLAWTFVETPDLEVVRGLFELRAVLEPLAAAKAAERRTRADIRAMREGLSLMSQHGLDHATGQAGDRAFHDAILTATDNEYIMVLSSGIGAAVMMTTRFKQRSRALPRDPIPAHRRVFDAIVAADPIGAAAAMQRLVDQALEDTRQAMDQTTTA